MVPDPRSIVSLIRLIRNMAHHIEEPTVNPTGQKKKDLLGSKAGVAHYFFCRFPRYILTSLWTFWCTAPDSSTSFTTVWRDFVFCLQRKITSCMKQASWKSSCGRCRNVRMTSWKQQQKLPLQVHQVSSLVFNRFALFILFGIADCIATNVKFYGNFGYLSCDTLFAVYSIFRNKAPIIFRLRCLRSLGMK